MTAKTKSDITKGILTTILGTAILGILYLLVDIRDTNKYVQPEIDRQQNESINNIKQYTCTVDSMATMRNNNSNKRIDKQNDDIKVLMQEVSKDLKEIKLSNTVILKHNKKAAEEIEQIKKLTANE